MCTPFGITLRGEIADREVYLEVEMMNVELFLDLLFKLDLSVVWGLSLLQARTQGCVMTATEELLLEAWNLQVSSATLYLDDQGGGEPMNITHAVDAILTRLQLTGGLAEALNSVLSELTSSAAERCAGTYDPSTDDTGDATSHHHSLVDPRDWTWQIAVVLMSAVLLVVLSWYHCAATPRSSAAEKSSLREALLSDGADCDTVNDGDSADDCDRDGNNVDDGAIDPARCFALAIMRRCGCIDQTCAAYDAIFVCRDLPLWLRGLFPVVVLACIVVVTASNMMIIASVMVKVEVGGVVIEPGSLLDFSLGATVHDM